MSDVPEHLKDLAKVGASLAIAPWRLAKILAKKGLGGD